MKIDTNWKGNWTRRRIVAHVVIIACVIVLSWAVGNLVTEVL